MTAQSIMPQGVPALPEHMQGARENLVQQYKKIPQVRAVGGSSVWVVVVAGCVRLFGVGCGGC